MKTERGCKDRPDPWETDKQLAYTVGVVNKGGISSASHSRSDSS